MSESAFLFDVNIWVALAFPSHPDHGRALGAYESASFERPALFCRATQQSFLRLASTPALLRLYGAKGHTNADALTAFHQFMQLRQVQYLDEPLGVVPVWHRLAGLQSASPKVWMDAYLAAFAIAGELQMVTFDRDFKSYMRYGLNLSIPGESV